jgi:hypothetical protein
VKTPPNLSGILQKPFLPSGAPATDASVRSAILGGARWNYALVSGRIRARNFVLFGQSGLEDAVLDDIGDPGESFCSVASSKIGPQKPIPPLGVLPPS